METGDQPPKIAGRVRGALDLLATILTIFVCVVFVWSLVAAPSKITNQAAAPVLPAEPIRVDDASIRGNNRAQFGIVEYADFQCPYCASFAKDTLPLLLAEYVQTGKVLFAFKNFPLPSHPLATQASEAALCAGRQGRFWELHDRLFAASNRVDAVLADYASLPSIHFKTFRACLDGEAKATVQSHIAEARSLGVRGTPTFFVGEFQSDGTLKVRHA